MNRSDDADQRFVDLEIKLSFLEDHVESLNSLVAAQQRQLEALVREVVQMRRQVPDADAGTPRSLRDELPPHY